MLFLVHIEFNLDQDLKLIPKDLNRK